MPIKVKQKNKNAIKNVANRYRDDYIVEVGFPGKVGSVSYPDGERVTDIAAQNEFGSESKHIPARPFMKLSKNDAVTEIQAIMRKEVPRINRGQVDKLKVIKLIAPRVTDIFKNTITALKSPPNAPLTIALKGSDNPLIDSSLMRNTLTSEIVKKKANGGAT